MANPNTIETYLADKIERIQRCNLKPCDNEILDWINDLNQEL